MGVTAFLGAGAAFDIGGPSVQQLTDWVRKKEQPFQGAYARIIDEIGKILDDFYDGNKLSGMANFEQIFYVLEMLQTYIIAKRPETHISFKPPFTPFIDIDKALDKIALSYAEKYKEIHGKEPMENNLSILISQAKQDLIKLIGFFIAKYSDSPLPDWYKSFWQKAASSTNYTIATLNYDTTIEQAVGKINDGFENTVHGFQRFNPRLLNDDTTSILHLHGSILFGYGQFDILRDNIEDLCKFCSFQMAEKTWAKKWQTTLDQRAQSGDETIIGPIITGLRKTDKLIAFPYSYYYYWLTRSLNNNKSLLIIGYSFQDLHFNSLLERLVSLNINCKIIIIGYIDFEKYSCRNETSFDGWPWGDALNLEFKTLKKLLKTANPLTVLKRCNIQNGQPAISDDGNTRIYYTGFKKTIENFGDEIIAFLSADVQ